MPNDVLAELKKLSGGALDAQLKPLADKQQEIVQAKKELRDNLQLMQKAEKPSAYPPELIKFLKKAGIKYGEKDGDQKKNLKLPEDKLANLEDQEKQNMAGLQKLVNELTQMHQAMSSVLKQMHETSKTFVRNVRG